MKRSSPIIRIICLVGACTTLGMAGVGVLDLWGSRASAAALRLLSTEDTPGGEADSRVLVSREKMAELESAGTHRFSAPQVFLRLADLEIRQANRALTTEKRIASFCAALSATGKAVRKEPYNGRYLVNWANLRQLLGDVRCPGELVSGDALAVSGLADTLAPADTSVAYSSGLIAHWMGQDRVAAKRFWHVARYATDLTDVQRVSMLEVVKTPNELSDLIPARFPQVVQWTSLVRGRFSDPSRFEEALASLHKDAIEESHSELLRGAISKEMHLSRLIEMLGIVRASPVRRLADMEVARLLEEEDRFAVLSRFFDERSRLDTLSIIRSFLPSDTRPLKSPLSDWGRDPKVSFDDFYESVGFFVSPDQTVKMVVLRGDAGGTPPSTDLVKVMTSDDNQNWVELYESVAISNVALGSVPHVVIRVEGQRAPYWKVQYASNGRSNLFSGRLSGFVEAYGSSTHGGKKKR